MLLKYLPLLVVSFGINQLDAACTCGDNTQVIGNCTVDLHICGCLENFEWKYKCTATDTKSGISASAAWYDSDTGAGQHAIQMLFYKLNENTCNCNKEIVANGYNYKTCYQFRSVEDEQNSKVEWKVWATSTSLKVTAYYCCQYNLTLAIEDSNTRLKHCIQNQQDNTSYVKSVPENHLIYENERIWSSKCEFTAVMQTDGNFVLYSYQLNTTADPISLWSSGTDHQTQEVYFHPQSDGNLVIYIESTHTAIWQSSTAHKGTPPYTLVLQDSGNLAWYDNTSAIIWQTQTDVA